MFSNFHHCCLSMRVHYKLRWNSHNFPAQPDRKLSAIIAIVMSYGLVKNVLVDFI